MGSDTCNKSEKKLRNLKGTKVMFWYKWLEQSSVVPGKGVGSGEKTNKQIISREGGPILPIVLCPWRIGLTGETSY